jgi:hypothetical protein
VPKDAGVEIAAKVKSSKMKPPFNLTYNLLGPNASPAIA